MYRDGAEVYQSIKNCHTNMTVFQDKAKHLAAIHKADETHQEEIAEVVGVSQQALQQGFLQEFPDLEKVVKNLLAEGHPHLDVARTPQDGI